MRYDPCGQGVAMLRTGYTARVRPWRDEPGDVEIRWYKCPPGARALGVPSLFRSLHWESHPYLFAGWKGEVFNSVTKVFPYRSPPGVTGQHHCGTDEDFAKGGHYTETPPLYPRADDGIAECCRPPLGLLIIDGMGTAPPGQVSLDSQTGFQITNFLTPPEGSPSVADLAGISSVLSSFIGVQQQQGLFFTALPGQRYIVPLAADEAGGDWLLEWFSGNLLIGFAAAGPVHLTDSFDVIAPAGAYRLAVFLQPNNLVSTRTWQVAPHPVPL